MTDVNDRSEDAADRAATAAPIADAQRDAPPAADRARLIACMELFFFAYRDFTGDADAVLETYGFGRAHHRVLHFVHRNPGLRVADLLEILKITKQSLSRVLKQLVDEGFIVQREGTSDRRERLLYVTAKGGRLSETLADMQIGRIRKAFATLGAGSDETAMRFLFAMIAEMDRPKVSNLIEPTGKDGLACTDDKRPLA